MFERYTEKARRVIFFARYEASQFGSPYIETEHLLLGLLREDKALTNRFLRSHASVESIRKQIEGHTTIREKVSTSVDLPLSNECKRVLAYAAEEAERHRRVVFVIDEAHLLAPDQLEEIRLLTNQNMDADSPFAGILVGQPTLLRQLRMGIFAALDQRIATRYTLAPMDLGESSSYLRHHLGLVGRNDPVFADDAVARMHRFSNGLPRALNNIATAALIAGAADGKAIVDDACAKKAVAELSRE